MRTRSTILIILVPMLFILATVAGRSLAQEPGGEPGPMESAAVTSTQVIIYAGADATVDPAYPDTNYGSSTILGVGTCGEFTGNALGFLFFDTATIPSGATIHSAQLRLYKTGTDAGAADVYVQRLTSAWSESTVTWNTRPSAFYVVEATTNVGRFPGSFYIWDLTGLVQKWVDGSVSNYGIQLYSEGGACKEFASREQAVTYRPRLEVSYTPNTPTPVPGMRSLRLDGDGDYVEIPYADALNNLSAITIEAWVKRDANRCETVVGNGWQESYWLGFCDKVIRFYHKGYVQVDGKDPVPPGQWVHIAVTYDGTTRRYYINGKLDLETTESNGPIVGTSIQSALFIGADRHGGCTDPALCGFQGLIDELRIWNTVRSQEEIQQTMYEAITGPKPGLVAVWSFDGDARDVVGDHDGILRGDATFLPEGFPSGPATPTPTPTLTPTDAATSTGTPTATPTPTGTLPFPAPPRGGPRPTIQIAPDRGYADQVVQVSGEGVVPYPGVRVVWLTEDTTTTAAVIAVDENNAYQTTISVPARAVPGPAKICAAVTGTEKAEFACAEFLIESPPLGNVQGQLPLPPRTHRLRPGQGSSASVVVFDDRGGEITRTPVLEDGTFSLTGLMPGTYTLAVEGNWDTLLLPTRVRVFPNATTEATFERVMEYLEACEELWTTVTSITASPNGSPLRDVADFGTYVSLGPTGSRVDVRFRAYVQSRPGARVLRVDFVIVRPDGTEVPIGSDATPPYEATYNVSLLPPGISYLRAIPVSDRGCDVRRSASIHVIENPMDESIIREGRISWDARREAYQFQGRIPNVGRLLPIVYPDPPRDLPLVGRRENRLDTALYFDGRLELDGDVHLRVAQAYALARLFGFNVFNRTQELLGRDGLLFTPADLTRLTVDLGRHTLVSFREEVPVFQGVLFGDWGVVTVRASIRVGVNGRLIFEGTLRPLAPAFAGALIAEGGPHLTVSLFVDIILGVASGGADANASATLGLPLRLDTEASPVVWLDTPCFQLRVVLTVWARVNLLVFKKRWNLDSWSLVDYAEPPGCGGRSLTALAQAVPPPRVMAAPSIATGPNGERLAVYIQDTTPDVITPTMKVMARFWNPQIGAWGPPSALTDGSHAVMDPVAAFIGSEGHAIVVWTENTMSPAEDEAAGDDLSKILARQELFYAYWDGTSWSAPQRLTEDSVADGRAALAGDASGATLAWVRDTDGNIATRADWRIAVAHWDPKDRRWKPFELLDAGDNALNAQVSVARRDDLVALAWTTDADTDLNTNDDRQIAVAVWTPNGWQVEIPKELPPGADSPSIDILREESLTQSPLSYSLQLAFLVRGKDDDEKTDTGVVSNQAVLWTASLSLPGGAWQAQEVRDEQNRPVRAERPIVRVAPDGEVLLLFRRFGDVGTNGMLGQLALTQLRPEEGPASPIYLTDDPLQHWQPALAIDPVTSEAHILNVERLGVSNLRGDIPQGVRRSSLAPASAAARPAVRVAALTSGDDPVQSLSMPEAADPAIDPVLELSQRHAVPGSTVTITATVRNVGRLPVSNLNVRFYQGTPITGTLLATIPLPETLPMNESRQVTYAVTNPGGEVLISVQVTTTDPDLNPDNNTATVRLNELPPPTFVSAAPGAGTEATVELTWLPPDVPAVAGYRILRSITPGGPYELVGETLRSMFTDVDVRRGQPYYYVVQAYDAAGIRSAYSAEVSTAVPLLRVYLPLVKR